MHFVQFGFNAAFLSVQHHRQKVAYGCLGQVGCIDPHTVELSYSQLSTHYLLFISNQQVFSTEVRDLEERVIDLNPCPDISFDPDLARIDQLLHLLDVQKDKLLFLFVDVETLNLVSV